MHIKPQTILVSAALLGVPAVCFIAGGLHERDLLLLGVASLFVSAVWIHSLVTEDLRYTWGSRRAYRPRLVAQPQWCACHSRGPMQGWRCLVCHKPIATWRLPPRLVPRRSVAAADDGWGPAASPPPPRPEPVPLLPDKGVIFAAAVTLVQSARVPVDEYAAATASALSDPSATRRLYVTAAQRLHPDHNGGAHLPEWFAVHAAVELLRRYHETQARANEPAMN